MFSSCHASAFSSWHPVTHILMLPTFFPWGGQQPLPAAQLVSGRSQQDKLSQVGHRLSGPWKWPSDSDMPPVFFSSHRVAL